MVLVNESVQLQWRLCEIGLEDYSFVLLSRCGLCAILNHVSFKKSFHNNRSSAFIGLSTRLKLLVGPTGLQRM